MTNTSPTVALFGSARPSADTKLYQDVREQARLLSEAGYTIATGGGPGLMEAANLGAMDVCAAGKLCSLGYSIYLPFEPCTNEHVQEDTHHQTFFTRLDQFCNDCDAFIANPGGYGTLLEILIVLQLKQVGLLDKPIILVGKMWEEIMAHSAHLLCREGFISNEDRRLFDFAPTPQDAAHILIGKKA